MSAFWGTPFPPASADIIYGSPIKFRARIKFHWPLTTSQYGETDAGLKRGNPLRLCPEMMAKLRRMWLNHGVCDEIAHKMESVHMYMATPWASL